MRGMALYLYGASWSYGSRLNKDRKKPPRMSVENCAGRRTMSRNRKGHSGVARRGVRRVREAGPETDPASKHRLFLRGSRKNPLRAMLTSCFTYT